MATTTELHGYFVVDLLNFGEDDSLTADPLATQQLLAMMDEVECTSRQTLDFGFAISCYITITYLVAVAKNDIIYRLYGLKCKV